jgi:hypothetical protein
MGSPVNIISAVSPKNVVINGEMLIGQRGTSFTSIADGTYSLDRWLYRKNGGSSAVHNISQITDVPTLAQSGYLFQNSINLALTSADTSIAAGEWVGLGQRIEGYNWSLLHQKPFYVNFWVKAVTPGIYCIALGNGGTDRSIAVEYTVNSSSTWEYKSVLIPASPSAGTWNLTNGFGVYLFWTLAAGSSYQSANSTWVTPGGGFYSMATASQVNGVNTGATDFRLTGISITDQPAPFSTSARTRAQEISLCQRYYEKSYDIGTNPGVVTNSGANFYWTPLAMSNAPLGTIYFKTQKRTTSYSVGIYNNRTGASSSIDNASTVVAYSGGLYTGGEHGFIPAFTGTATTGQLLTHHWVADAEL